MRTFPARGDNFTNLGRIVVNETAKYLAAANTLRSNVMRKNWRLRRLRAYLRGRGLTPEQIEAIETGGKP